MLFSARVGWFVSNIYATETHHERTTQIASNENLKACILRASGFAGRGTYNSSRFVLDQDHAVSTNVDDATGRRDLWIKARRAVGSSQSRNHGLCRLFH